VPLSRANQQSVLEKLDGLRVLVGGGVLDLDAPHG
jgi:hypothetical protein